MNARASSGRRRTFDSIARQERLLPFFLKPSSYPHRPRAVRLVQTHASWVFLAPPFVYKVKKAVNFGFLDFSTLARRRHFCEREVALNRRLCPRVYLGVVPVRFLKGRCRLGEGEGTIVEYAVKMRRLSDRFFLNRLIERGEAGREHLNRIARTLRQFYEAQRPTAEIEAWGRLDRLRISTDENFRQVEPFVGASGIVSRPAFGVIRDYTDQFYSRRRRLFAARIRERRILDCHGDLHLDHIHVTPRALHIYDCIEFNDRFRYVDVASDVAFLAMDLDCEGRSDLSRHFAARMAAVLHDEGMPRLMDFYKCYRACVRAKVECLRSVAHAATDEDRRASVGRARRYVQLALRYVVAGSRPLALVVMGRVGSGKSALARALGAELGWEVYSSDQLRKKLAGFPLYQRAGAAVRRRLYSRVMTEKTYNHLLETTSAQLQKGRSVILDATFARRVHRARLVDRLGKRGIAWRVIEVRASDAALKQRLRVRGTKPDEVSDARLEDFATLTRRYEPPVELSTGQCVKVRASGPIEQTLTKALQILARMQVDLIGSPR